MKFIYLPLISYLILGLPQKLLPQLKYELPVVEENVCPFEGCQFGQWIIRDSIKVYKIEGDTSSVKFLLSDGDTIKALTGNIHYEKFGKVLVTQPFKNFNVNDTVTILRCIEGDFIAYFKGQKIYVDIFWPVGFSDSKDEKNYDVKKHYGKMSENPEIVWWVKMRWNDKEGWLSLRNINPYCFQIKEKIEGMDIFE